MEGKAGHAQGVDIGLLELRRAFRLGLRNPQRNLAFVIMRSEEDRVNEFSNFGMHEQPV